MRPNGHLSQGHEDRWLRLNGTRRDEAPATVTAPAGAEVVQQQQRTAGTTEPPVKSNAGRYRLVDYAFAVTIRLHHGNAGEGKLLRHIQTTTLEDKRPMTWQGTKGKGDDEIRSVGAQEFNDLVPVMVEMGIGEQGLRKRSIT